MIRIKKILKKPGWIPAFAGMTLILLTLFLFPKPAFAAGYGISISPPLLRVNIKPNKSISQVFTITNLTSDDKLLVARMVPFSEADIFGNPVIDLKSSPDWLNDFSLANSNIKLGNAFTLKGNTSEQLVLNLTVPEDSPLRDLYATLLVSTYTNVLDLGYQGSQVNATIGSNLLITINTELNPPTILKINHLAPTTGSFFKFGNLYLVDNITPISFSGSVKNDGNFTAESKGIFKIVNRNDTPTHLEGILPVNVIAHTERILINNDGKDFTYTPNLGNIGQFKVILQIKTDNSNAENTLDIIFFPFKIGAGLILSVFILASITKRRREVKSDTVDSIQY